MHLKEDTALSIRIMTEILNVSEEELLTSRAKLLPYARAIISEKLVSMGYSKAAVGKLLNKDHSTIVQSLQRLKNALKTKGFADVRNLRERYLKALGTSEEKLLGAQGNSCVWNVQPKDRLCIFCKIANCKDKVL